MDVDTGASGDQVGIADADLLRGCADDPALFAVFYRRHVCRLEPGPLATASAWLRFYERFWTGRLDALVDLFDADGPTTGQYLGDDHDDR